MSYNSNLTLFEKNLTDIFDELSDPNYKINESLIVLKINKIKNLNYPHLIGFDLESKLKSLAESDFINIENKISALKNLDQNKYNLIYNNYLKLKTYILKEIVSCNDLLYLISKNNNNKPIIHILGAGSLNIEEYKNYIKNGKIRKED